MPSRARYAVPQGARGETRGLIAKLDFVDQTLETHGLAEKTLQTGRWRFLNTKDVVVFRKGLGCDQSPRAITPLLAAGCPAERCSYYRGGMQTSELWGLTSIIPGEE